MNIKFQDANGSHYAGKPQTERRDNKRYIRFAYAGCTGYLLLRSSLDKPANLHSEELQHAIMELGDRIRFGCEEQLPGMEHISLRYVSHNELYRNNDSIEIVDTAASYAVCGVWDFNGEWRILLPLEGMSSTVSVAIELTYSVRPYVVMERRFLRSVPRQTDFYQVEFKRVSGYVSGLVCYTIGNSGLRYPVMEKMIGATTLIKTNRQIPEFHSLTPGVTLIRK